MSLVEYIAVLPPVKKSYKKEHNPSVLDETLSKWKAKRAGSFERNPRGRNDRETTKNPNIYRNPSCRGVRGRPMVLDEFFLIFRENPFPIWGSVIRDISIIGDT